MKDDILNLPPLTQQNFDFDADLTYDEAAQYNALLGDAQKLRMELESHRATAADLQKLMAMLQRMQQMLVSPLLATKGAEYFKKNTICYSQAASRETGSLRALYERIKVRQAEGHNRIMVAACHVTIMKIAKEYLQNKEPGLAEIFTYDGTQNLNQRQAEKRAFLTAPKSILFLSIGAGGTGLHLVPGCNCGIFWGSRPFSPAQNWQTAKRLHRIGQDYEVFIDHLIPHGGVDFAIDKVHVDKAGLAGAVVDDDWSHFDDEGGNWKKTGRIVDNCAKMQENGNFPPPPKPMEMEGEAGPSGAAGPSAPYVPPAGPPLVVGFALGPAVMEAQAPPNAADLLAAAEAMQAQALPPL